MESTTLFVQPAATQVAPVRLVVPVQPAPVQAGPVEVPTIEPYSEKSIVLRSSKDYGLAHKASLQALGGKFNPRLRGGAGWVFPLTAQPQVEHYIQTGQVLPKAAPAKRVTHNKAPPQAIAQPTPVPPPAPVDLSKNGGAVATQTVTYTLPKPLVEMKGLLRANGGESPFTVTEATPRADGTVDIINLNVGGQPATGVVINGSWQVYGYAFPHELHFLPA